MTFTAKEIIRLNNSDTKISEICILLNVSEFEVRRILQDGSKIRKKERKNQMRSKHRKAKKMRKYYEK